LFFSPPGNTGKKLGVKNLLVVSTGVGLAKNWELFFHLLEALAKNWDLFFLPWKQLGVV